MDIKQERVKFEAWAVMQKNEHGLPYFIVKSGNGFYADNSTNHAWNGWQASQLSNRDGYAEIIDKVMPSVLTCDYANSLNSETIKYFNAGVAALSDAIRTAAPTPDGDRLDAERYKLIRRLALRERMFFYMQIPKDADEAYFDKVIDSGIQMLADEAIANKEVDLITAISDGAPNITVKTS